MDRIQNHPILGESPEGRKVTFYYDGNPLEGIEGEPIMAALKVNGVMVHRYTAKKHEPRGVFCAIEFSSRKILGIYRVSTDDTIEFDSRRVVTKGNSVVSFIYNAWAKNPQNPKNRR